MAGPRQTGKTTLAQMISGEYINRLYFNWDNPQDRTRLIENRFFFRKSSAGTAHCPWLSSMKYTNTRIGRTT
ncbi:MAG: AAA family ATPase [Desulfobacterales bacterium]|nr:MAG: AAA family ATPase [Desulfobacterales bacterium]